MRLLIIDSDLTAARSYRYYLRVPATIVSSGEDGVALVRDQGKRFDAIITSVIIGNEYDQLIMNGLDAYKMFSKMAHGHKVIFTSKGGLLPELEAEIDALPNAKLTKPVIADDLRAAFQAIRDI